MYKIVFDANVWIRYARSKNISPLIDRFTSFDFLPVTNNYLLSEVYDAIVENKWMHPVQATKLTALIKKISLFTTENAVFAVSPDPKDNYLFDLAVQNNCLFIITDDSKLLRYELKPVPVHSTDWFLNTFPV